MYSSMSDILTKLPVSWFDKRLLIIMTSAALLNLVRRIFPPLMPSIIESISITSSAAGLSLTLMTIFFALSQYPSGRISDHSSRKTLVMIGLMALFCSMLILYLIPSFISFLIGISLVGLGGGTYLVASRLWIADNYFEKRGLAIGLHSASDDIGGILATVLAIVILALVSWRATFLITSFCLLPILLLSHLWLREKYVWSVPKFQFRKTVRGIVKREELKWVIVTFCLYLFTFYGLMSFLPLYLQLNKGLSPTVSNGAYGIFFLSGIVAKPSAGHLSDRFGRIRICLTSLSIAILGLGVLILASESLVIVLSIVFTSMGLKGSGPVLGTFLLDSFSTEDLGAEIGAVRGLYTSIGGLGPVIVGVIADFSGYTEAFSVLFLVLVISALLLYFSYTR